MEVYLVRHGEAQSEMQDPARSLSGRGQVEVEQVAAFLGQAGVHVESIRHSGKLRAEQTALILAELLKPPGGVVTTTGLAPNDDVEPVAKALAEETLPVMLVGHLPLMSRLASLLLVGNSWRAIVNFQTAAVVCLAGEPGRWVLEWSLTPDLVRRRQA